jgi:hypothetical protein
MWHVQLEFMWGCSWVSILQREFLRLLPKPLYHSILHIVWHEYVAIVGIFSVYENWMVLSLGFYVWCWSTSHRMAFSFSWTLCVRAFVHACVCHSAAWQWLSPCSPQSSEPTECCSVVGCLTSCIEPRLTHMFFISFDSYIKLDGGFTVLLISVYVIIICSIVWQFRWNLKQIVDAIVSCMPLPGPVRLEGEWYSRAPTPIQLAIAN